MHLRHPMLTSTTVVALLLAPIPGAGETDAPGAVEPQFPQQQSARDLLTICAASRMSRLGRERKRYCAGFVSGVEEAVRLLQLDDQSAREVCTPENTSANTLAEAFVTYGATHRGELPDPAALVVLHALQAAYPCPEP